LEPGRDCHGLPTGGACVGKHVVPEIPVGLRCWFNRTYTCDVFEVPPETRLGPAKLDNQLIAVYAKYGASESRTAPLRPSKPLPSSHGLSHEPTDELGAAPRGSFRSASSLRRGGEGPRETSLDAYAWRGQRWSIGGVGLLILSDVPNLLQTFNPSHVAPTSVPSRSVRVAPLRWQLGCYVTSVRRASLTLRRHVDAVQSWSPPFVLGGTGAKFQAPSVTGPLRPSRSRSHRFGTHFLAHRSPVNVRKSASTESTCPILRPEGFSRGVRMTYVCGGPIVATPRATNSSARS
jgi:hypothetical protein